MSHVGKKHKAVRRVKHAERKKAECTYVPQFPRLLYQKMNYYAMVFYNNCCFCLNYIDFCCLIAIIAKKHCLFAVFIQYASVLYINLPKNARFYR